MFVLLIIVFILPFHKPFCLCWTQNLYLFTVLTFQNRGDDALENCSSECLGKDLWTLKSLS